MKRLVNAAVTFVLISCGIGLVFSMVALWFSAPLWLFAWMVLILCGVALMMIVE